jgi:cytochrome c nitrite reductase small subunit
MKRIGPLGIAALALSIALGAAVGFGAYTFVYAKGGSYMTNDPAACANCHVMNEQYDGWLKSSHHTVAVCNDCHTPHDFFGKYFTKALNGYHHSVAFTSGDFHEPIRIGPRNAQITEDACRSCHRELTSQIDTGHHGGDAMSCVRCHRNVGHAH